MSNRDLALVTTVLRLAKDHWVRTGTAIRPEEASLVLADAQRLLRLPADLADAPIERLGDVLAREHARR